MALSRSLEPWIARSCHESGTGCFMVRRCYPDHVIVAVDASVGQSEHVGCITWEKERSARDLG